MPHAYHKASCLLIDILAMDDPAKVTALVLGDCSYCSIRLDGLGLGRSL
jgi:hypothetical protein